MKYLHYIIALFMAVSLGACTHNDGDIGDWFGDWIIASYTVDGQAPSSDLYPLTVISFQNQVVRVDLNEDEYDSTWICYGSWSEQAGRITFDFGHSDDHNLPGTGQYTAPEWIGWISSEPMTMTISDSSSRAKTLTWTAPDGSVHVYKIKKTW